MTSNQVFRGGLAALAGIAPVHGVFFRDGGAAIELRICRRTPPATTSTSSIRPPTRWWERSRGSKPTTGSRCPPTAAESTSASKAWRRCSIVVDGKTLQVIKRIPLSGVANLIDLTPDGRWIYVAIAHEWDDLSAFPQIKAQPNGGVDVIDTVSLEKVKTIAIKGGIHDLNVTPDGKYVIAGLEPRRQAAGEHDGCDRHARPTRSPGAC